ncbi:Uncharacterised protein [Mycobacteroides abscessus subsp. abscessus]|nr:Uncharacterised protein [Mycobacteroides abscessus subsp. abscessus]
MREFLSKLIAKLGVVRLCVDNSRTMLPYKSLDDFPLFSSHITFNLVFFHFEKFFLKFIKLE